MKGERETYLGDGLYASWDGWQIILRAPREGGDHWVGLDDAGWTAQCEYIERVRADLRRSQKK